MYGTYSDLRQVERIGCDYVIREKVLGSGVAVMAPHGGRIEPGTSELAESIAGREYDFYAFEGMKENDNAGLHIASTLFDEPRAITMAGAAQSVITIHGCAGNCEIVFVGGLFRELRDCIREHLELNGFQTAENPFCRGIDPANLCNRCRGKRGVQIELTAGLRRKLLQDKTHSDRTGSTELFGLFVKSVGKAISECITR